MKIIIPVKDNEEAKSELAKSFHNSDFASIYDTETKAYEWLSTTEISKNAGNLSLELKRKGVYVVISNHMSLMALGLFAESGITVFKAKSTNLEENIDYYHKNELPALTSAMTSTDDGCASSCSSCKSTTCN